MLFSWQIFITSAFIASVGCIKPDKDEMIAEESERYYSPLRYSSPAAQQSSSQSSSGSSSSSSSNSRNGGDIYKKSASEYWPQMTDDHSSMMQDPYSDNSPFYPMTNSIQQADYLMTSVNQAYLKGKDINVMPDHKPITLHYRTHAQPIVVHQTRLPGPKPEVKHTTSHEEPQRVVHEVIRPIIQEVHEIIQPYRRVVQQVQPVIEEVRTIIAKDAGKSSSGMGAANMDRGSYSSASASLPQLMSHKPNPHYQHQSVSGSNEVFRHLSPKTLQSYRKAMYEQSKSSEDDHVLPMATTNNQQNNRFIRSRVYLTPKGEPVYQSNYRPPVYLSA
uniref:Uncharacterized protein LOC113797980 n=1 Tax=Dermatophagoides pteronyssinus TaxID=6956 RepID=A0A6P6YG68_DERPT|nr:uncharacterized protein LOC113797980 [Dermatophagoides pteronyssinus]